MKRSLLTTVAALAVAFPAFAQNAPASDSTATAAAPAKPKWDVQNPPGASHDASIDVTEGTWMSLDVSPDGREIVFDLLGDIYVMPITGGEARAIASGVAWDMQPKYSPDGRSIAFTSDRGGGDNLWVMDRDGSNARQVSNESFRLLTQPDWSPDGQFIVGRKHFTSSRSLGAGEMWMYHRAGGGGVQLTERRTQQKDTGEPAFSPDGRYLYFSDDATPGGVFDYSKDPNTQIYVIRRLDRETGEITPFVTGPGGSIRPTPSPDGKTLAFIRRDRYKSVLYVMDLESGRETPIYDALDRDLQETWAIHGVYPTISWTPDNRGIVFWAGGKIHRIDVASKAVSEIPFHVADTRRVQEAARELGMMVVPEGGSLYQHNMTMVVDGHTTVEHSIPLAHLYADVHQLWRQTKVAYTPTLIVAYGGNWGENYWYQATDVWNDPILTQYVPRRILDSRARRPVHVQPEELNHISIAREAKRLADEGVSVQIGAHGQREGLGAHWELWMFEQGGMTPLEALRVGTLNGATALGMDKDIGSLETGKLADLVVLDANPLENLRNTVKIGYTMVNGRIFDNHMNEVGQAPRQPFWHQSAEGQAWSAGAASAEADSHGHSHGQD